MKRAEIKTAAFKYIVERSKRDKGWISVDPEEIAELLGETPVRVKNYLNELVQENVLQADANGYSLSEENRMQVSEQIFQEEISRLEHISIDTLSPDDPDYLAKAIHEASTKIRAKYTDVKKIQSFPTPEGKTGFIALYKGNLLRGVHDFSELVKELSYKDLVEFIYETMLTGIAIKGTDQFVQ
ncbi:MAG: hypothetical protein K8L99_23480 [Anaerolineae bacterium]|nr:hypothetical protein [Anaerolineae bacterium]